MAKGNPPSPAAADSSFPVFVDSSLDTHLAMVVSPDDNVADLRRKIRIEHALCFPNVGEITIQAIKVKRRSSFYNLSNSMLVRSAFNGIKGIWFLHIDAAPVSMMKSQAGIAENVVSENVEQSQKHVQLHPEPNASASLGHCSDKLLGVVDERQSLLETSLDRLANHGNSSLPNARNCQIESLHGSSHDQMGTGDTDVDASKGMSLGEKGVSRLDQVPNVMDVHEEVGLHVQSETDLVVGQEEDGGEKGSENPDVGSSVGDASIFATKKEKARKRSNISVNNLILDGDSEHLSREKKKHKENDGSFMELPLEDPAIGNNFERPAYKKETPKLKNAPPQTNSQEKHLAFSEELSGKLLQGDSLPENLVDDKRKKKKRKKSSKSRDEVEPAVPSNDGDISLLHSMEEPHTKIGPYDNSADLTGTVIPVGEQAVKGHAKEAGVNNYKTLTKEPDAAVHTEGATKNGADENQEGPLDHGHTEWSKEPNVLDGLKVAASLTNPSGVDEGPTNSLRSRKMSKNELPKTMSSKFDRAHTSECVTKENIGEASGGSCRDLHEESDAATILKEFGDPNKLANLDVEVPSGTDIRNAHRRKKKTKKTEFTSLQTDKNGTAHPSGDQVIEENCKETLGDTHRELGKEYEGTTVLREAVALENPAAVHSGVLSNIDEKRSRRKRKKSAKSELQNHEFAQQESAHSLGKGHVKEKPTETLETNHKDLGKESKPTTSHGEPAALGSPSKVDFVIPSNNNDKISHHHKKKLAKSEVFSDMSSNHDLSSRDQSTQENFKKAFGTIHRDSGNESIATMLADDGSQNISHGNISKLDSTWLINDSSNKHETAQLSAKNITQENRKELLGNTHDNSGKEIDRNLTHKSSADSIEVNEHMDLPGYGSGKTNFKVVEHESVVSAKELPLKETETEKLHKGKSKRKRKSNMRSQDSTANMVYPSSSNEQHMHKKKYQDADHGNHFLTDSMAQLTDKEVKTKEAVNEKTVERSSKSNVNFGDTSSILTPPRKPHGDSGPGKKLQEYKSDTFCQVSLSRNEHSKHVHHPKEKSSVSDGKLKSHNHQDDTAIVLSLDDVPQPENLTTVIRGSGVGAPATQSDSADAVADLAASSDSTEDIPHQTKRYRVSVRKVPSKIFGKALTNSKQEKPLLATSTAIFDDATSGSSDDEFGISNREDPMEAASDNSSMSADSYGDLEETHTPGIKPAAYDKKDEGTDGRSIFLSQSNASKKNMPLGAILRNSSSYKKARLLASQSQAEDSESQPINIVPETQPDSAEP